ncbi:MAG: signal peptidase I [Ruminococcaceae bacterium]|nr:signal peptidase I [Oscillospiraceae bacterium]
MDQHSIPGEIPTNEKKEKPGLLSSLFDYLEIFIYSAIAVILIFTFGFRLTNVMGPSMEDTLIENEKLLISNLFYEPEQGDIIVFHELGYYNEPIVKRVIATEGQVVDIDFSTWTVTVDGVPVEEDYRKLTQGPQLTSDYTYPMTVPENCLFVMGDNRNHSADSRSSLIGFVDCRQILGRVICRVSPFDRFGAVD